MKIYAGLAIFCLSFLGTHGQSFLDPSHLKIFADHCKTNNVELDEEILEEVQTCLDPVIGRIQTLDYEERIPTICKRSDEIRTCYLPIFELLEQCVPSWVDNEKIFRPIEIFDNVKRGVCDKPMPTRIENLVELDKPKRNAVVCYVQNYKAIGSDALACPVVLRILMDPANSLTGKNVCGVLDQLEECVTETMDICEDKKNDAMKFAHLVFDVVISLAFKCEGHENFY